MVTYIEIRFLCVFRIVTIAVSEDILNIKQNKIAQPTKYNFTTFNKKSYLRD